VRQPDTTLVSVVVPAYNAAATLDETLCSVRAQTHRTLEIIVVDDGSSDETPTIVERHAAEDPRLRLLRQTNAGVAAARNAGWRAAKADLISFIDADDLWAPTKVERQLQALEKAGPKAGLVYCWTARLAEDGTVSRYHGGARHDGDALSTILRSNYIGSGSNVLVRRQALVETNGFDPRLREANAQGCEDWLFCCRVAESHHVVCVPEYLIGYRYRELGMSRDRKQTLRSHVMMCDQLIGRRPDLRAVLDSLQAYCVWLLRDAANRREWGEVMPLWFTVWRRYPWVAWRVVWRDFLLDPVRLVRDRVRRPRRVSLVPATRVIGQHFLHDAERMQP
jgi:glycosyltransferase involved in cell wall biosynthesis